MTGHRGSCLCGAVTFTIAADLPPGDACHCTQCRKQTGHYLASTNVPKEAVSVDSADHVSWYRSSEKVRRGFCSICGSTLFWEPLHRDWTSVALGAIDGPTDTRLAEHIFTDDKGDYSDIADGLPQK